MGIKWLEPWDSLFTDGSLLEQELYKEVRQGHVLYGKKISVLGRRYDCDEFLFEVNDIEFRYAVVHLTFSGKGESGSYPRTKVYKDLDDCDVKICPHMLPYFTMWSYRQTNKCKKVNYKIFERLFSILRFNKYCRQFH